MELPRFRPAEIEAELHLIENYGTAFECRAREVSVDVRWRNCRRKLEIVVPGCAEWYSTAVLDLVQAIAPSLVALFSYNSDANV